MTQQSIAQSLFPGLSSLKRDVVLSYIREHNFITEEDGVWVGRLPIKGDIPVREQNNSAKSKEELEFHLRCKIYEAVKCHEIRCAMGLQNNQQPLFGGVSRYDRSACLNYIRDNNLITEEGGVWVGRLPVAGDIPIFMPDNTKRSKHDLEFQLRWKIYDYIKTEEEKRKLEKPVSRTRTITTETLEDISKLIVDGNGHEAVWRLHLILQNGAQDEVISLPKYRTRLEKLQEFAKTDKTGCGEIMLERYLANLVDED